MKVALFSLLSLIAGAGAFAPHTKSRLPPAAVRRAPSVRSTVKSLADVAAGNPLIAGAARTIEFTKKNLTPELAPPPSMAELEKYVEAAQEGGPEAEDVQTAGKLIFAVMVGERGRPLLAPPPTPANTANFTKPPVRTSDPL